MMWKQKDPAFFRTMTLVWFFPSIGALVILGMSQDSSLWAVENTLAGAILMVQVFLVFCWVTSKNNCDDVK
jgi:hypothetical protein